MEISEGLPDGFVFRGGDLYDGVRRASLQILCPLVNPNRLLNLTVAVVGAETIQCYQVVGYERRALLLEGVALAEAGRLSALCKRVLDAYAQEIEESRR